MCDVLKRPFFGVCGCGPVHTHTHGCHLALVLWSSDMKQTANKHWKAENIPGRAEDVRHQHGGQLLHMHTQKNTLFLHSLMILIPCGQRHFPAG